MPRLEATIKTRDGLCPASPSRLASFFCAAQITRLGVL